MRVELTGVSKRYGATKALAEVSFALPPGEIVAVLGANGAGKSTLLRCLAGFAIPDRGEIRYDGELFRRQRVDLRRRIAYLPDVPYASSEFSLLDLIGLVLQLYGVESDEAIDRVGALLEEFDLVEKEDACLSELSRGQAYKANLVALLATDPELWLLDEPLASGVDPPGLAAFKRHVRAAAARGRTVIYTTQILDSAERFSDTICILDRGRVQACDRVERLLGAEAPPAGALEDLFLRLRTGGSV